MVLPLLQDIALYAIPHRSPFPNFPLHVEQILTITTYRTPGKSNATVLIGFHSPQVALAGT